MTYSDDVLALNPQLSRESVSTDGFDSNLERAFDAELRARGFEVRPHGWTFHLPGSVDYTPDFVAWSGARPIYILTAYRIGKQRNNHLKHLSGMMVYEVKGSMKQHNARDSRTRFKVAAGLYPQLTFVWVTRDRAGQWIEKVLAP
jgi:hypothetical protein